MIEREYIISLPGGQCIRERIIKERGQILAFVVQLETYLGEKWHPVMRYDTAHGFTHLDILRPDGTARKVALDFPSYNAALTFAQRDLKARYQAYVERYRNWWNEQRRKTGR